MTFASTEEIRKELGLAETEPGELRRAIRRRLKEIHPDTMATTDSSADNSEEVQNLTAALEYLDRSAVGTSLLPLDHANHLVQLIRDLMPNVQREEQKTALEQSIREEVGEIRRHGSVSKVTLTTITAVLTALWMFPTAVADHPVLSRYLDPTSEPFGVAWLQSVFFTGLVWLWIGFRNKKDVERVKRLQLEGSQTGLFISFARSEVVSPPAGPASFHREELVDSISGQGEHSFSPFIFPLPRRGGIDIELADNLAASILTKAKERGVIKKIGGPSIKEKYEFLVPLERL